MPRAALREREHAKAAALVDLVASTLEQRGITARTALLCARVGMDAFSTAIRRWSTESGDLHVALDEIFDELRALIAPLHP
ncbi:hypothetical protein [Subtercola sp. RTI3]|uniref:hypothetical protein n=1 Tax=Subtercola sp. RTI3 TaxID=3048639 RepID=UPI002B2295D5|nr:hypothetical protein [Subtercola sp. RTI3]MEA9987061.1 hypothetical protein [Subtercola sp. RTI3]